MQANKQKQKTKNKNKTNNNTKAKKKKKKERKQKNKNKTVLHNLLFQQLCGVESQRQFPYREPAVET